MDDRRESDDDLHGLLVNVTTLSVLTGVPYPVLDDDVTHFPQVPRRHPRAPRLLDAASAGYALYACCKLRKARVELRSRLAAARALLATDHRAEVRGGRHFLLVRGDEAALLGQAELLGRLRGAGACHVLDLRDLWPEYRAGLDRVLGDSRPALLEEAMSP
jgi:hypothetical protein